MRAKKSLGQNFLHSKRALGQIVRAGNLNAFETVLEIGPGKGVLTRALLSTSVNVIAIEKDRELIDLLNKTFEKEIASGKLKIIYGDALEIDVSEIGLKAYEYKIIANIPYYITGQFLRKFLSGEFPPKSMVLLLQKEVVSRIIARDKKESILSISVKAYGTPKFIGKVSASDFKPAPQVDSAIIAIENISKKNFLDMDKNIMSTGAEGTTLTNTKLSEENFFALVRAGFAHKRKKLVRNLESVVDKEKIEIAFEKCGIAENTRAEDLSLEKWLELCGEINKFLKK